MTMALDYDAVAEEQARSLRPDLSPDASKGDARSYRALVRMLSVANECNDLRSEGSKDAVSQIAKRRGVTESTVRMILHRAQNNGVGLVPQPTARTLLRSRYVDVISRYSPGHAEELADELLAIWDVEAPDVTL
ncbi:MAG: hypothetical protein ACRDQ0_04065 [Pseudonocardia sp.]